MDPKANKVAPYKIPEELESHRPFEPRGGALELLYASDRSILFEGPAGTGKTRAVLEKAHLLATKFAGIRVLLCRKTRASMTESILVTFESKVLPEGSPIKDGPERAGRKAYNYPNGSVVVVAGLDDANRIMSTEFDFIASFESTELTQDDGDKLRTRLRNAKMPLQQWVADCNPAEPTHWLNQEANAGKMRRILSRHHDNPTVTQDYLRALSDLTGARRARLFEGRWASQEGLVYSFDHALHLIDRFEIPKTWRRFRVIDFGYTNPFVCQWWAEDNDGRLFMYREIYYSRRLVSEHAEQINELSKGEQIAETLSDHDAEDRATLEACGIYTEAAPKSVSSGIQLVQKRLQKDATGRPRLFILRDSLVERDPHLAEKKKPTSTLEEFDGYVWPDAGERKELKEAPVKVNDHGMDATRYLVNYLDGDNVALVGSFSF